MEQQPLPTVQPCLSCLAEITFFSSSTYSHGGNTIIDCHACGMQNCVFPDPSIVEAIFDSQVETEDEIAAAAATAEPPFFSAELLGDIDDFIANNAEIDDLGVAPSLLSESSTAINTLIDRFGTFGDSELPPFSELDSSSSLASDFSNDLELPPFPKPASPSRANNSKPIDYTNGSYRSVIGSTVEKQTDREVVAKSADNREISVHVSGGIYKTKTKIKRCADDSVIIEGQSTGYKKGSKYLKITLERAAIEENCFMFSLKKTTRCRRQSDKN